MAREMMMPAQMPKGLVGHPGEGDEDDGCDQITDAQVFGRRMKSLSDNRPPTIFRPYWLMMP